MSNKKRFLIEVVRRDVVSIEVDDSTLCDLDLERIAKHYPDHFNHNRDIAEHALNVARLHSVHQSPVLEWYGPISVNNRYNFCSPLKPSFSLVEIASPASCIETRHISPDELPDCAKA